MGHGPTGRGRVRAAGRRSPVLAPPTYADGTVYVPVHALGRVAALDAASGEVEWWRTLEAPNVKSSPAVADGRAYVGSADGSLYCIE